jgi:hypothetical protein
MAGLARGVALSIHFLITNGAYLFLIERREVLFFLFFKLLFLLKKLLCSDFSFGIYSLLVLMLGHAVKF